MVTDSSDRTQYQPQVKILKRQTESSAVSSDQRFYLFLKYKYLFVEILDLICLNEQTRLILNKNSDHYRFFPEIYICIF